MDEKINKNERETLKAERENRILANQILAYIFKSIGRAFEKAAAEQSTTNQTDTDLLRQQEKEKAERAAAVKQFSEWLKDAINRKGGNNGQ